MSLGLLFTSFTGAHAQTCNDNQFGQIDQGNYLIQNDEWNLGAGPGGWQQICTGSASNNSWSAEWWWPSGSGGVKAYPAIVSGWEYGAYSPNHLGFPVLVSANDPINTTVTYNMYGNNQYDAAYDLFFSPSTNPSAPSAELMVWLSYSGTQPIGTRVAQAVTLGNESGTWDIWQGNNGQWNVWSFVKTSQTTSFSGELQPFLYFVAYSRNWLPQNYYLLDIQFGVEILNSNGANGGINVTNYSGTAY
jgi:xyloglucan-specific endo-beta-1,4-glucanase